MPKDDVARKKLSQDSRAGYMRMYRDYCAQASPANPEVCSNEALKKVYSTYQKTQGAAA